ncbi:hypothetical protein [Archangium sp. Cb G35]|uniref:hypothetical protein n=1 Tax=Archangium sp. Cb G35 TaxID=1920190 RepID=UPI0011613F7B|nr:hypothetical protein [Archangium sp. Cb G35]
MDGTRARQQTRREPRARWSSASGVRARQPNLGCGGGRQRIGSRASGPVETTRARQPKLGPVEGTRARWRAPAHRQPSLGPVARISGAVEAPRARQSGLGRGGGHQGGGSGAKARREPWARWKAPPAQRQTRGGAILGQW